MQLSEKWLRLLRNSFKYIEINLKCFEKRYKNFSAIRMSLRDQK